MGDQGERIIDLTSLNSQFLEQTVPLLEASSIRYYFIYSPVFFLSPHSLRSRFSVGFVVNGIFLVCLTQRPIVSHRSTQVCWLVSSRLTATILAFHRSPQEQSQGSDSNGK